MSKTEKVPSKTPSLSPLAQVGLAFGFGIAVAGLTGAIFWLFFRQTSKTKKSSYQEPMSRQTSHKKERSQSPNVSGTIHPAQTSCLPPPDTRRLNTSGDRRMLLQEMDTNLPHPLTSLDSVGTLRAKVKDALKEEDPESMLSKETLLLLNELFIAAYLPKFRELTVKNRKKRRVFLEKGSDNDFKEYAKCCLSEIKEFDEGMAQNTEEILAGTGIESEAYHSALQYYTTIDKEFYVMVMMMFEKLKVANRKKEQDITYPKGKDILKRQIEFMQQEDRRMSLLEEEHVAPVKQVLMNDTIYKEFRVEEEDFLLNQIEKSWEQNEDFLVLVNQLQAFM